MDGRRMAGAIAGALVAGIGITTLMIAGERRSGAPSELIALQRTGAHRLGIDAPADDRLPGTGEQALAQGNHLLLSAAAGAAYAALTDEDSDAVTSGVLFGLGFYAVAHWIVGPLLGLKRAEWDTPVGTIGMHTVNHVAFGLATAAGAKLVARS